jgi:exodeoxyribonuclease VII small subunit
MTEQQTDSHRPVDQMSFREMLDELEDIVRKLESNQLELEESLRCYERGVELLRASKTRLGSAQQKVTTLLGELEVEDDDSVDTRLS